MVWVTCEGENPADIENIGSIQYLPERGFAGQYFPFKNTEGYLSPLVAVYFENPKRKLLSRFPYELRIYLFTLLKVECL